MAPLDDEDDDNDDDDNKEGQEEDGQGKGIGGEKGERGAVDGIFNCRLCVSAFSREAINYSLEHVEAQVSDPRRETQGFT